MPIGAIGAKVTILVLITPSLSNCDNVMLTQKQDTSLYRGERYGRLTSKSKYGKQIVKFMSKY